MSLLNIQGVSFIFPNLSSNVLRVVMCWDYHEQAVRLLLVSVACLDNGVRRATGHLDIEAN